MSKKTNFQNLVDEALANAQKDRKRILDAYKHMKGALEIDTENDEQKSTNMLIGGNAVKLLEQATRANEQIVKLAQIKERQEQKSNEGAKKTSFDVSDIMERAKEEGIDIDSEGSNVKFRVEENGSD